MKLHGSHRSPYVQKVRVFIREKGVPCEFLDNRPASVEVRAINPLSQIPTLELEDGSGLYDSSVIVEYIDGAWPENPLIPLTLAKRNRSQTLGSVVRRDRGVSPNDHT